MPCLAGVSLPTLLLRLSSGLLRGLARIRAGMVERLGSGGRPAQVPGRELSIETQGLRAEFA
jgi:hypothetical protein